MDSVVVSQDNVITSARIKYVLSNVTGEAIFLEYYVEVNYAKVQKVSTVFGRSEAQDIDGEKVVFKDISIRGYHMEEGKSYNISLDD